MKQFARCANCRQWYLQAFTMAVEIFCNGHLHRIAMWCVRCVEDAEQRSQPAQEQGNNASEALLQTTRMMPPAGFHQLVQEHIDLMDRAIHEEDTILVPLIEDFMARCRSYQQRL
ncbi:MAG TPA: hypothetical protein VIH59_28475, partial [Candidatus Tectomicrobia bacterium]